MPKFTFPIPGRRQKSAPAPPHSAPLSKAQKILGTGGLNVDSPTIPKDQSRFWDSRSNSGISISISEASTIYDDHGGRGKGIRGGRKMSKGPSPRLGTFEEESDILPPALGGRKLSVPGELMDPDGHNIRSPTDASSLRRRESSSTIMSYYDKNKVPLGISQQTSASAMAKGLPPKASSLLDIDGTLSSQGNKRKNKPARLDLSYLLPTSRSPTVVASGQKELVLGPDLVTRSPSAISEPPLDEPFTPARHRGERRLRKRNTKESIARDEPQSPPPTVRSHSRGVKNDSTSKLNNLYEHYEQMSFRDVMAQSKESRRAPEQEDPAVISPPLSTSAKSNKGLLSPFGNSVIRPPFSSKRSSMGVETPITAVLSPSSLKSSQADCSASISSRHTRTSKASKRTNPSIVDLDLLQNSVLSLSSDSEDDFMDSTTKSTMSTPRSPSEAASSPGYRSAAVPQSPPPVTVTPPKSAGIPQSNRRFPVPTVTVAPPMPMPLKINPRSSSLSISTTSTMKASRNPTRSSSRLSILTTSTANSFATSLRPPRSQPAYGVHEARAITMIPAKSSSGSSRYPRDRSSDQPTPPLSPTSVDFYLRSQHTSMMDFDQGSIRSALSLGTVGSGRNSAMAGNSGGRVMAVTRQEEMLLAAMRQKRARMKTESISEYEEEEEEAEEHAYTEEKKQDRRSTVNTSPELFHPRPQARRSSVSFSDFPMHIPGISAVSASDSSPSEPSSKLISSGKAGTVAPNHNQERVIFFLDGSAANGPRNPIDASEPSPDLSDFMDFDDSMSSDQDSYPSQNEPSPMDLRAVRHSLAAHVASPERGRKRGHSTPVSPKTAPRRGALGDDDVHVRIVEDAAGMPPGRMDDEDGVPRPDSPVNGMYMPTRGEDDEAFTRKKAVRISAVGRVGMEVGWWGDDG